MSSHPSQSPVVPQHMEALAQANVVRSAMARSKRDLKTGQQSLADALGEECWQKRQVLEVVGYAAVAMHLLSPTSTRRSETAGRTALKVCGSLGIGHFTRVGSLSLARRAALLEAWEELYRSSPANSRGSSEGSAISRAPSPQSASAAS